MTSRLPHIISASRRTDLVAWYPDRLADKLLKIGPERIHTLVIWTKNPRNIFENANLSRILRKLDQIFIHLTVTGLGGTEIEPGVPSPEKVVEMLDDLVEFVGSPDRIRWRFDPLLTWVENGERRDNTEYFRELAPSFLRSGIKNAVTSFCTMYPKVFKRFEEHGRFVPVEFTENEKEEVRTLFKTIASECGIRLKWCCDIESESSICVDGGLLSRLHPKGLPASMEKAPGQRETCMCTKSWDIGWYTQVCSGGCLYCYGSPAKSVLKGDLE